MVKQTVSKEYIIQYAKENPTKTLRELGNELGISHSRIGMVLKQAGIDGKERNERTLELRDEAYKQKFLEEYNKDNYISTTKMMERLGTNRVKTLQIASELGITLERKDFHVLNQHLDVIEDLRKKNHTFEEIAEVLGVTTIYAMRLASIGREQGRDIPEGHLKLNRFGIEPQELAPKVEELFAKGLKQEEIVELLGVSYVLLFKVIEWGREHGYNFPKRSKRYRPTKEEKELIEKQAYELRSLGRTYREIADDLSKPYNVVRNAVLRYEQHLKEQN